MIKLEQLADLAVLKNLSASKKISRSNASCARFIFTMPMAFEIYDALKKYHAAFKADDIAEYVLMVTALLDHVNDEINNGMRDVTLSLNTDEFHVIAKALSIQFNGMGRHDPKHYMYKMLSDFFLKGLPLDLNLELEHKVNPAARL